MSGRAEFLQSAKIVVRKATKKWLQGEPASVEAVLSTYPQLAKDGTCVMALIWAEYLVRRGRGDEPKSEEFSQRFPRQKRHIEKLFAQKLQEQQGAIETIGLEILQRQDETQFVEDPFATISFLIASEAQVDGSPKGPIGQAKVASPQTIGRFQLKGVLGQGAFGKVYRAHDPQLDREVALKVPRVGTVDTPKDASRFLREARAAGQLRHPNIVPVFDAGQINDTYYIASGFIQGETLQQVLEKQGKLSPQDAARIIAKMASALHYAHTKGIVHRDLKPANTMMDGEGEPLVMDFGLARRSEGETLRTMEGAFMGTPAYMSPEQASGDAYLADGRSDQWTLGVMLYEMLTGTRPFQGDSMSILVAIRSTDPKPLRQHDHAIPRDLENICLRCLEKHPGKRYRECRELAEDLECWLRGDPVSARPISALERLGRWGKRNPAIASLVGAIATLAVAFVIFVGLNNIYLEQQRSDLAKAVALADEKSKLASEKEKLAKDQTKLAREQKLLAEQFGNEQKAALEKLKTEVAARQRAETARQQAEGEARDATTGKTKAEREASKANQKAAAEEEQRKQKEEEIATLEAAKDRTAQSQVADNYFLAIEKAHRYIEEANIAAANELLETCNPSLRNWEWYHLKHRITAPGDAVYDIPWPMGALPLCGFFAIADGQFVVIGKNSLSVFDPRTKSFHAPIELKGGECTLFHCGTFDPNLGSVVGVCWENRVEKATWVNVATGVINRSNQLLGKHNFVLDSGDLVVARGKERVFFHVAEDKLVAYATFATMTSPPNSYSLEKNSVVAISTDKKILAVSDPVFLNNHWIGESEMIIYRRGGLTSKWKLKGNLSFAAFCDTEMDVPDSGEDWLLVIVNNKAYVYDIATGIPAESLIPHRPWIAKLKSDQIRSFGTRFIASGQLFDSETGQRTMYLTYPEPINTHTLGFKGKSGFRCSSDSRSLVSANNKGLHVMTIGAEDLESMKSQLLKE